MDEKVQSGFPLAYLITLRSYGSWLHGDEKGSVDRHGFNVYNTPRQIFNPKLKNRMKERMTEPPFKLDKSQRIGVLDAVNEVCEFRGYNLIAVNIRANHLHALVSAEVKPEKIINEFKAYCTRRLRQTNLITQDQIVWSRGGSRRYLWKESQVKRACEYVLFGQGGEIFDLPNQKPDRQEG